MLANQALNGRCLTPVLTQLKGCRAAGYDEPTQRFIIRNSWGSGWGIKGYCIFPYALLLDANPCDDFWTVRVVE